MKKIVSFLFISICILKVTGQSLAGYVCAQKDKSPVEFATITLLHLPDSAIVTGVTTAANGGFEFTNVASGKYYIKVNSISYGPAGKQIILKVVKPKTVMDTIFLRETSTQIGEVTVKGARLEAKELVDRTIYKIPSEIAKTSTNGYDILKKIPQVQVDFNNNITLNGSTNFIIQVDGKIRDKEFLAKLQPNDIESIEIISNPSGKYEGDIDGIINVVLKKEARVGTNGNYGINVRTYKQPTGSIYGGLDYGTGKITYYVTGYSWLQQLSLYQPSTYSDSTQIRHFPGSGTYIVSNSSITGGIDYYINDHNNLNLNLNFKPIYQKSNTSGIGYIDSLQLKRIYQSSMPSVSKTNSDEENISLFYKRTYKKPIQEFTAEARLYFYNSTQNQSVSQFDSITPVFSNNNSTLSKRSAYTLKADYVYPIGVSARVEAGYQMYDQFMHIDFDQSLAILKLDTIENTQFSYNELRNAAYGGLILNENKWSFQVSLRVENSLININDSAHNNYTTLLPSANIQYKFTSKQNLKLTYNRRIVRPSIGDLNPATVISAYNTTKGNPYLKPEYFDKIQLTYTLNFGKNYLSPNIYYQLISNENGTVISFPYGNTNQFSQPLNVLSGYEKGFGLNGMLWFFNINARFFEGHFDSWGSGAAYIPAKNYSSFAINSYVFSPLPWKINAFAFINYNGPSVNAYSRTTSTPFYGLGGQKVAGDHTFGIFYLMPLRSNITMNSTVITTPATSTSPYTVTNNSMGFNVAYFIMVSYSYKFNKGKAVKKITHEEEQESDTKTNGIGK